MVAKISEGRVGQGGLYKRGTAPTHLRFVFSIAILLLIVAKK
jgi:hypothetical protein